MKTILVTGARGLVGTHLLEGHGGRFRFHALERPAGDLSRPIDPAALPERIDGVVYLAQSSRFREFPEGAADMFQVNVARPLELIEEARARGATHFVYASTGSVYAPGDAPLSEADPAPANGFYASSKRAAEQLLANYGPQMSVMLLRFFFVYGAGQKRDMLMPRLADSVRDGRAVSLQGQDGIRFQPLHAADAAQAAVAALSVKGSHTINVAGPEALSMREVCEAAGRRMGREPVFNADAAATPKHLVADTTLMERLLGPATRRFEDGVADIVES